MFKFSLSDKLKQQGISPDIIPPELRNRFDAHFGTSPLNGRVQVRLDPKAVRFFYYTGDLNGPVLVEDKYKEIVTISLSFVKETGFDILNFGKTLKERCPKENSNQQNAIVEFSKNLAGHLKSSNNNNCLLSGFPFVDTWDFNNKNNDPSECFIFFMRCCFLYFIFEMEDRKCDFAKSPLYDEVRNKLRESFVYQLLSAKIKYTVRLYEGSGSQSEDDYSFVTRKFADLLMDSRINKIISPYCYYHESISNIDYQPWFYDPEDELEAVLEQNRCQEQKGYATLENILVLKIRDFLYTKHAVYNAMTKNTGKRLFRYAQELMGISSLAIIFSSFCIRYANIILHYLLPIFVLLFVVSAWYIFRYSQKKKKEKINGQYSLWFVTLPFLLLAISSSLLLVIHDCPTIQYIFCFLIVSCIVGWIAASGYYNNPDPKNKTNGVIYAFHPRILVAELAAWLTIGIGEDLVKSMLWIDNNTLSAVLVTLIVVLFVIIILYGEAKQHSPYKPWQNNLGKRVLPIINHSVFFAFCMGFVMQMIFYDNLVKNSDVIQSVVYNNYFDDANYYLQELESLNESMRQMCVMTGTTVVIGDVEMEGSSRSTSIIMDTNNVKSGYICSTFLTSIKNNDTIRKEEERKDYNKFVNIINKNINELFKIDTSKSLFEDKLNYGDSLSFTLDTISKTDTALSIDTLNKKKIYEYLLITHEEISNVRRKIASYSDYDTLMKWSEIKKENFVSLPTNRSYFDTLTSEAKSKNQCWVNIFPKAKTPWRLFPSLLIFHTLIVLVLAFVTQLIISNKSVTEPL